ncbi:hypothetical protein [Shewanella sp. Isolate11]|uniref:hypothetical protein n=1 Tax=Shewanella sp. Isolate11 TaxID=2908530 RepID=UPI001EFCF1EB|nr:hypothetical protein [Shewanella sp. Isolate11]MCG9697881.1 hypothetical protein [Shewanella sp. Isolate11]
MNRKFYRLSLLLSGLVCSLLTFSSGAKEHKTLLQKADAAEAISQKTEQEQLEKARQAAQATESRDQELLKQQTSGWEEEQLKKAQQQFNQRESREEKYLREAKEAAAKERKIPKP